MDVTALRPRHSILHDCDSDRGHDRALVEATVDETKRVSGARRVRMQAKDSAAAIASRARFLRTAELVRLDAEGTQERGPDQGGALLEALEDLLLTVASFFPPFSWLRTVD